jgi:FHS family glucose/mannose:H+ symporter-like MFS transporter
MIWPYIIISYGALLVFGISDNIRGPLYSEIIKTFGVNNSMGSMIFSLSSISGFLVSFLAVYLLNRYGQWKVLKGSAVILTLTLFLMAMASHFTFFITLSIIYGLSSGILALIPNILVSSGTTIDKRQQFLSGLHAMYGLSSLLAPILVNRIDFIFHDWRYTYIAVSILPLILVGYAITSQKKIPVFLKTEPINEKKPLNKSKNFKAQVFVATILGFYVCAEVLISSRLAIYTQNVLQFKFSEATLFVSYFFIALLISRIFFALVKIPLAIRTQLSLSAFTSAIFLIVGLYYNPIFFYLIGLTMGPFYPHLITFLESEFSSEMNQAVSIVAGVSSIMLAMMHSLTGILTDRFGIYKAMHLGIFLLMMACGMLFLYQIILQKRPKVNHHLID